jgi:hypothetical protein
MPKITWEQCPFCGRFVKQNGCGRDDTLFQRVLTNTLDKVNPVTTTLFRIASDAHDLLYHQGDIYGLGLFEAQKDADDTFLQSCLFLVDNPDLSELGRFNRGLVSSNEWYFRHKAHQYYRAVRWKGHEAFPKLPCTHPQREFIKGDTREDDPYVALAF